MFRSIIRLHHLLARSSSVSCTWRYFGMNWLPLILLPIGRGNVFPVESHETGIPSRIAKPNGKLRGIAYGVLCFLPRELWGLCLFRRRTGVRILFHERLEYQGANKDLRRVQRAVCLRTKRNLYPEPLFNIWYRVFGSALSQWSFSDNEALVVAITRYHSLPFTSRLGFHR